jgi:hypothetical protein
VDQAKGNGSRGSWMRAAPIIARGRISKIGVLY